MDEEVPSARIFDAIEEWYGRQPLKWLTKTYLKNIIREQGARTTRQKSTGVPDPAKSYESWARERLSKLGEGASARDKADLINKETYADIMLDFGWRKCKKPGCRVRRELPAQGSTLSAAARLYARIRIAKKTYKWEMEQDARIQAQIADLERESMEEAAQEKKKKKKARKTAGGETVPTDKETWDDEDDDSDASSCSVLLRESLDTLGEAIEKIDELEARVRELESRLTTVERELRPSGKEPVSSAMRELGKELSDERREIERAASQVMRIEREGRKQLAASYDEVIKELVQAISARSGSGMTLGSPVGVDGEVPYDAHAELMGVVAALSLELETFAKRGGMGRGRGGGVGGGRSIAPRSISRVSRGGRAPRAAVMRPSRAIAPRTVRPGRIARATSTRAGRRYFRPLPSVRRRLPGLRSGDRFLRRGGLLFPRRRGYRLWNSIGAFLGAISLPLWSNYYWFRLWYYNRLNPGYYAPWYTGPLGRGLPPLGYVDPSWSPDEIDLYIRELERFHRRIVFMGYRIIFNPLTLQLVWAYRPRDVPMGPLPPLIV